MEDEVVLAAMREVSEPLQSMSHAYGLYIELIAIKLAYEEGHTGRNANRGRPVNTEDGDRGGRNFDRGGRGGRGNRGPRRGGDRHSRTGIT